jgi:hypothetical protein
LIFEFYRYDFDNDGLISAEDVKMILSYIPFRRRVIEALKPQSQTSIGSDGPRRHDTFTSTFSLREGLYNEAEGRNMDHKQRNLDQEEIKQFLACAFVDKPNMNLEEYTHFNQSISSEMLISVMAIIHEKLPCAQFYFRQRRLFKERYMSELTVEENKSPGKLNSTESFGVRSSEYFTNNTNED